MTQQILDPASEVEAEMAGTATACLVTALDHSKAEVIKVTIDLGGQRDGEAPVLLLPPRALRFFADVLRQMAKREPMLLIPQKLELTTQEAAAFLNVSRPFVIKEIEAGRLKYRLVNRHRRIEFEELKRYQAEQKQRSEEALRELNRLSEDIGQEL
jgi:excisionase family DNA binding protein